MCCYCTCACVRKHMQHVCQHVCVIIQRQEEFSPLPLHGRLKQSTQHRMWEVKSSTHTLGPGPPARGASASSERPAAEHRAQSTELSPQNSGRRRQPMLQSYFWSTNESLFDFKITKLSRRLTVLTYSSIIWDRLLLGQKNSLQEDDYSLLSTWETSIICHLTKQMTSIRY